MTDAAPENPGTPDETAEETPYAAGPVPVLAVVGRPNVGKSTLVNRIIGRREAVVEDVPGVTRDRVSYDATWNGRAFTVVDTGGWDPDARGLAEAIRAQAEIAVNLADAVLFVVDATVGITDADEAVVKILRASGKPVVLAANKVDDQRMRGRGPRSLEPRARRAVPGLRAARPRLGRHARRHPGGAAGAAAVEDLDLGRPAPHRDRRQAERRQVLAAQQAGQGGAGRRRRRRRHHRRPGRRADRARRRDLALHRHRGHPQAGQGGLGPRVLRLAAHQTAIDRAEVAVLVVDGSRARSPSRTSGSSRPSARPAGRW